MGRTDAKVTHHCPRASEGNCRMDAKNTHCTKHQYVCPKDQQVHMKGQRCETCYKKKEREDQRKQDEKMRLEAEKAAAATNRSKDKRETKKNPKQKASKWVGKFTKQTKVILAQNS
ncbi:MAG: hypothetical protein M1828_003219 [Chrysothrix sp. TS-e1954]|nr:MAG: hypothetical protein M1828_003219 [Chrysothrix sp. TS-e1954]